MERRVKQKLIIASFPVYKLDSRTFHYIFDHVITAIKDYSNCVFIQKYQSTCCDILLIIILTFTDSFHQDKCTKMDRLMRLKGSKHVTVEFLI